MEIANLVLAYIRVLIWPAVVLVICLVFRDQLIALISRVRRAELPGGIAIDLDREIREAKALSVKVQEEPKRPGTKRGNIIQFTEANARLIQLGLRPSPSGLDMSYYRDIAQQDPSVALAGLRIEIAVLARNLAKGFKIQVDDRISGARLLRKLYDSNAITADQMQLALKVLHVCNAAVHGTRVSRGEAEDVISSAEVLADQYLAWLSWGFPDGWAAKRNE